MSSLGSQENISTTAVVSAWCHPADACSSRLNYTRGASRVLEGFSHSRRLLREKTRTGVVMWLMAVQHCGYAGQVQHVRATRPSVCGRTSSSEGGNAVYEIARRRSSPSPFASSTSCLFCGSSRPKPPAFLHERDAWTDGRKNSKYPARLIWTCPPSISQPAGPRPSFESK